MPSRSLFLDSLRNGHTLRGRFTFFLCLLGLFLTPYSLAADEVESSAPAKQEKTASADRVYVVNGATITWDLENKQYRKPNKAQAAELAEQFSAWMEAKLAKDGKTLATAGDVEVETLPNGMKMAQLPVSLMSVSMVQVNSEGHFEQVCTEAHETSALEATETVAVAVAEEEKR